MEGFPHRELDVYKRTIEAISLIARISSAVPSRDGWLAKQIRRSAGSILLNLGEACGEHSPLEKARIFRISRRSAFETADGLQLVRIYSRPDIKLIEAADVELFRIASMLTKMSLRCEEEGIKKLGTRKR
jgi:four helix bundle protein